MKKPASRASQRTQSARREHVRRETVRSEHSRQPSGETPQRAEASTERLQKVLAAAGLGSRRKCEELITTGRVEVDGHVVTELGVRVDRQKQRIRVDGTPLRQPRRLYYMVNKPMGVVSTSADPAGRMRVIDLVPAMDSRVFTVGRLDLSSEGLILVTNDGELADRLTHPRYGVEKTYEVTVAGVATRSSLARIEQGVHLAEGVARATRMRIKAVRQKSTLVEIVLTEGHNREIRRLLARAGHKVLRLRRVALGSLRLADLPPGEFRRLTDQEVRELRASSRMTGPGKSRQARSVRSSQSGSRRRLARLKQRSRPEKSGSIPR